MIVILNRFRHYRDLSLLDNRVERKNDEDFISEHIERIFPQQARTFRPA